MSDISLQTIALSLVLISGLVIGMSSFVGDMFETYNIDSEEIESVEEMKKLSRNNELKNNTEGFKGQVEGITGQDGWDWGMFIGVVTQVGSYLFFLPKMVVSMLVDLFDILWFIPGWFQTMIWTALMIVVVFIISDYILNRRSG